jgi:hypothetical protein
LKGRRKRGSEVIGMANMKILLVLAFVLALPLGCGTLYKGDRPESEVPKEEIKRDQIECNDYAVLECSKVTGNISFARCKKIHYRDCLAKRGWHKEKRR